MVGAALASHKQLRNSMKQYVGGIDTNEQPVIGILS